MAPAPRIGTEFAGYHIEALLARGGMGVVYRAEHPRLGASIALKVMSPDLAMDETFRERFVREARVAARVNHPNIVPIYDAGEFHGDLYLAMRYVEGDDLRSLLQARGTLPVHETFSIGMQIAGALDAAHREGLVHRDVKPGNILLEPSSDPDSPPIAYLADLGLTKQLDTQGGGTDSGELVGTIDYMSPEQINGTPLDGRADVYSLACVLFECLTGSVPYERENKAAVLWGHLHDDIPRASGVNPSVPRGTDAVLSKGMAKEPEERFASARELIEGLREPLDSVAATRKVAATESRDLTARDRSNSRRSSASGVKARRGLLLAVGAGAVIGAALVAWVMLLTSDPASPPQSPAANSGTTTQAQGPSTAGFTAFDKELLPRIPAEIRPTCKHEPPLTDEFDSTISCRPKGSVESVSYSHARSGQYLFQFLRARRLKAGLPVSGFAGSCSTGAIPSINNTVAMGFRGRAEALEPLEREELLGRLLCYEAENGVRLEWVTQEPGIFAIAKGSDLFALYSWWSTEAGPEP